MEKEKWRECHVVDRGMGLTKEGARKRGDVFLADGASGGKTTFMCIFSYAYRGNEA